MINRKFTQQPLGWWPWIKLVVPASYPQAQHVDALYAALEYTTWLGTLPTTTERNA